MEVFVLHRDTDAIEDCSHFIGLGLCYGVVTLPRSDTYSYTGFPLGLENLENWEGIFQSGKSQGILNKLEKSGKITQNTGKLREFEINII